VANAEFAHELVQLAGERLGRDSREQDAKTARHRNTGK
jgi:hypothetical protein